MKAKITVVVTREIELQPELYPESWSVEQMLEYEKSYANDSFHEWSEFAEFNEATGELIE